ncbi:MAG TPA: hypothetical protein VEB20_01015 [Azospirillaceae bacterium]|nr:hypothetical protein [Azospirillaceae bacterium]
MPYLLKAQPYDPDIGGTRTLYVSDIGFTTEPGDSPANTYWERRIDAPLTIRRSLFNGSAIGGFSSAAFGSTLVANSDGGVDHWTDYEWDGRLVEILYTGNGTPTLSDFAVIFSGTAEQVVPGDDLEIVLADLQVLLDKPASRGTFAGTGGIEGTAELKGREKPFLLGIKRRFTPVLINAALNIYMIDPEGFHELIDAEDGGDPFTVAGADQASYAALAALSMTGLDYATAKAAGLIRLATPPVYAFTVSAKGVAPGGTWIARYADLVEHAVTSFTTLTAGDLDAASFTAMNGLQPAELGYWYDGGGELTVRQLVDELSDTVGAWWGFDEGRKLEVGRYDEPAVTADFEFTERDILDLRPRAAARRVKTVQLGYRHYATLLTSESQFAGTPTDAFRESAGAAYRWTDASADAAPESLLGETLRKETLFDAEADAEAERDRLADLLGARRKAFDVVVPLTPGLEVGHTVRLTDSRYGLSAGRNFRVLETVRDASAETHTLTVTG